MRVFFSVSFWVHSQSDRIGLLRLVDDLLAELDRLGQDDLFLGVEERHLADLLEVHPDRVVDADHVGGDRVELLRGGLFCSSGSSLAGGSSQGWRSFSSTRDVDAELGGTASPLSGRAVVELVLGRVRSRRRAALAALENACYELLVSWIHVRQCLLLRAAVAGVWVGRCW